MAKAGFFFLLRFFVLIPNSIKNDTTLSQAAKILKLAYKDGSQGAKFLIFALFSGWNTKERGFWNCYFEPCYSSVPSVGDIYN